MLIRAYNAEPVIISCAVSGGLETPQENPNVPWNPEEIGRTAIESWREGAAIIHIHARGDDGEWTGAPEMFERTIDVIRSAGCDAVLNLTTSYGSVDEDRWDDRFAALAPHPEMASFDCGTMNWNESVFYNRLPFLRELGARMAEAAIRPELEIFDAGMIRTALRLRDEGVLCDPLYFQFVMGIDAGVPATGRDLVHLVGSLPEGALWSACSVSRNQLPINALAIAMGGHTRTGLEDNTYYRRGELASNPMLVARVRRLAETLERPVASPGQARELLQLRGLAGSTGTRAFA